jgi:hypothetical protein
VGIREQDKYSQTYAGLGLDSSRQVVAIRVPGDHTHWHEADLCIVLNGLGNHRC